MNKRWNKLIVLALMLSLLLALTACASSNTDTASQNATEQAETATTQTEGETAEEAEAPDAETAETTEDVETVEESETTEEPVETAEPVEETAEEAEPTGKTTLVVYFSATGITKGVAETIAQITDADLYEIQPAEPYTDDDLNWNDNNSRSTIEQNDSSARPEIAGEPLSLEGYKTVFIGYPIWWGEEPRIVDTFVESYDFDGITVMPFCTSGGSGIGRSGKNLEENAGSGTWLDGERFGAGATETELRNWIEG